MCGIFGSVFEGGEITASAAVARLRHRGPDAEGVYQSPGVILAHTRLSILDLSPAGAQPMTSADGRAVVVFNGEIYNHHELRNELLRVRGAFRSRSDTEVIVEGYRAHGPSFFERLDGMFAIGLFDLDRRTLFLVRDRTGKKPLFYTFDGRGLRFASEERALFASGVTTSVRVESLPMLLSLGYVPPPWTLYRRVFQLPPARILQLTEGGEPHVRRYWSVRFDEHATHAGRRDVEDELRRLVIRAVKRRLEADVPLGAFLSGGIDSSIVVGLMAHASSQRVKTFSIGFAGDRRFDETHFARAAASAFGTDHTEFTLEPSAFELLDALVEAHGGPFGDSSAIPTSVVSMLTRRRVTVALTGDGGDELFAGYSRFLAAAASERVPQFVRSSAAELGERLPLRGRQFGRIKRGLQAAALTLPERILRWQSCFTDVGALLRPELREQVEVEAAGRWLSELAGDAPAKTPLGEALQLNFESYLPYDLLVKADRASMLHSLELRSPFLDTALIEFAARLPNKYRVRYGTTKWVLRQTFRDLLPRRIRRRGKMGFGMPLASWFRTQLREFVHDTLAPSALIRQFVDMTYVARMLKEHETGEREHQHPIWLLLTMERWLRLLPSWQSPQLYSTEDKHSAVR